MNWKKHTITLICLGVGFILGFFFGWSPVVESIRNYVVGIISLSVGIGLGVRVLTFFIELNEKKEMNRLEHSKKLVDIYLKSKTNTQIDFDRNDCKLQIHIIQLVWDFIPSPESNQFCAFFETHLINEYADIRNNIKKRDEAIRRHNLESQKFITKLNEAIHHELHDKILGITEWNGTGEPPLYYYRPYFFSELGCRIEPFYKYPIEVNRLNVLGRKDNDLTICYGNNDWIRSNFDLETIKSIVISVLNNLEKEFNLLKELYHEAKDRHEQFKHDMIKLKTFIESNVPLKGKCEICRNF